MCLLIALLLPVSGLCADNPVIVDTPETADAASDTEASPDEFPLFDEADFQEVSDPLEPLNRGFFWFNDKLYFYLAKPVARAYRYVPEPFRVSVNNFFQNLRAPIRIANAGLQGKFASAGNELTRFFTNTTLGIGGLFDPAKVHFNLKQMDEDTGQTLGHYGIGPGPYLMLPVIGASNLRDGIGLIGDANLSLVYHLWGHGKDNNDYFAAYISDRVNELSLDKDTYEGIKEDALDPYLFIRDAYAQYRRNLVDQ
jgi:phospholipid-binding lipoprotein MlaA